jgi:hypothetical protein
MTLESNAEELAPIAQDTVAGVTSGAVRHL